MFGFLAGEVRARDLIVCGGSVGYQVTTVDDLVVGEHVELYVHTAVRQESITLYGFATVAERDTFVALCGVTGVGPAVAMKVLRGVTVAELAAAVRAGDPQLLNACRGVSAKLRQQIVSAVKLPAFDGDLPDTPPVRDDLVTSLTAMGFEEATVADTLREMRATGITDEPALLAAALRKLSAA
jgi:Holliday junction DNA helicase RuvA